VQADARKDTPRHATREATRTRSQALEVGRVPCWRSRGKILPRWTMDEWLLAAGSCRPESLDEDSRLRGSNHKSLDEDSRLNFKSLDENSRLRGSNLKSLDEDS